MKVYPVVFVASLILAVEIFEVAADVNIISNIRTTRITATADVKLKQVAEFKEAFQIIDHDKDGIISKNDLRATFDSLSKLVSEKELDEMLGEMMIDDKGFIVTSALIAMLTGKDEEEEEAA